MNRSTQKHGAGGFTLMEMAVAMTLLGFLMMALFGSIGFVGNLWDESWRVAERSAALARVDDIMRRLVERSFPMTFRVQMKEGFLFRGSARNLRLVSYDASGRLAPGFYVQELLVIEAGDQRQLLYRQFPFRTEAAQYGGSLPDQSQDAPMLVGDFSFNFSYFGSPSELVRPGWFDTWESDRALPDLIRLRIVPTSGEAWPAITVRPMITADYACINPSITGICRLGSVEQ